MMSRNAFNDVKRTIASSKNQQIPLARQRAEIRDTREFRVLERDPKMLGSPSIAPRKAISFRSVSTGAYVVTCSLLESS